MDGDNYLTTDKLISLVSTLVAVIIPILGFTMHLEMRFNNLNSDISSLTYEVNSLKRTVKCTIMAVEKGYNIEVCGIEEGEAYL